MLQVLQLMRYSQLCWLGVEEAPATVNPGKSDPAEPLSCAVPLAVRFQGRRLQVCYLYEFANQRHWCKWHFPRHQPAKVPHSISMDRARATLPRGQTFPDLAGAFSTPLQTKQHPHLQLAPLLA